MSASSQKEESLQDLVPHEAIRLENVFTRMPIHRLAKRGRADIRIVVREAAEAGGQIREYWKVHPNDSVGEPGPLAYRVDRFVVSRALDEAGRPLPRILPLGELRPMAREVGLGSDTNSLKVAFQQNAFVGITAKLSFRDRNGNDQWIDNHFTRYNVIFRGGTVEGRRAECAYLILNDPYYGALNGTDPRPLDYDYLKQLPPAAQRWYELISPRMFAMFRNGWRYAEIPYSDFCTYSTLARHTTLRRIHSQLARIHRRHYAGGYISQVQFRKRPGTEDDLLIRYYPGLKAIVEHLAFKGDILKGPYRRQRGDLKVKHLFRGKQSSQSATRPNSAPSDKHGAAESLVVRFVALRHGIDNHHPDQKEIDVARKLLATCEGDLDLAEETVVVGAEMGKESSDPNGYPSHIAGVLKGPYVEVTRKRLRERSEARQRSAHRDRRRRLEAQYDASMAERARQRLDALTQDQRQRIIDERLDAFLDDYRYLIKGRRWDPSRAREWAEPRLFEVYAREGEPTLEEWFAARGDELDSAPTPQPTST